MDAKELLGVIAFVFSIINGLVLLMLYLRDKPKLSVKPIYPDVYQWWFKLPNGTYRGNLTREYGFLAYVDITNRGLRKITVTSMHLRLNTIAGKKSELKPINIPQLKEGLLGFNKIWVALAQKGLIYKDNITVESGCAISGMTYYIAEFYGEEGWNPKINKGRITGKLVITDVFGHKSRSKITFSEIPFEEVESMIAGISNIA